MEPTFWTVPEFLIETFPELKDDIEAEYFSWCDFGQRPYPHTFLEYYVLVPLMKDTPLAPRAGAALETVIQSEDEDLVSAGLLSVIDILASDDAAVAAARPHLGPTSADWMERLATQRREAQE
jgi:hypothetical protein